MSISESKPRKEDGKFITNDFIGLTKYLILEELFSINQEFSKKFNDLVICLDSSNNWRKEFFPHYKAKRAVSREDSEINYDEVFFHVNGLIDQMRDNLPWKVVKVNKAEADDIMLVLSKEYNRFEKILIHSPDKDMIQAQRDTDNVFQYSALTKKWIVPTNKNASMNEWIVEHICLGDAADEVPKIVDHTEFSESFISHIKKYGYNFKDPLEFKNSDIDESIKINMIKNFNVYKTNRKGESTGIKDIYKKIIFGPTTLKKELAKHGSLDNWLNSNPLYRKHYDRNFKLVMAEGIPSDIWNNIILEYKKAKIDYNDIKFEKYLMENNLQSIKMVLNNHFKINRELTAEDFNW